MRSLRRTLIVLGLVFFCAATPSRAVSAQEPLRLTTGDDYAPFVGQALPGGGMLVALVRDIFASMGMPVEIDVLPWERGRIATSAGRYAATFPYVRTAERAEQFLFSAPLFTVEETMWITAGSSWVPSAPSSLVGRVLCLPIGYAASSIVKPLIEEGRLTVLSPPKVDLCPRMVASGRADVFIIDNVTGPPIVKGSGLDPTALRSLPGLLKSNGLHLMAPRAQPRAAELIASFDRQLAAFRADGRYAALTKRHLDN